MAHVSPSFSATLRVRLDDSPGTFARVAEAIGGAGGSLGAIDIVRVEPHHKVRDVTVSATNEDHLHRIADVVRKLDGIEVLRVSDRTFLMHLGGKIEMQSKVPLKTRDDLSMAYTPGVARISQAIADDPASAWNLTVKQNTVAVVSDGTAVLGLGDIGPEAAMPVMEGKAVLFKEFGGVDAWPLCLATKDPDEIVAVCKAIAPGFGGINLEDISAPRCFEIEARLREELDIPVFHDDQHGTAIVVLAALVNALRGRRQANRGREDRDDGHRRSRDRDDRRAPRRRSPSRRRVRPRGCGLPRPARPRAAQGGLRRAHESRRTRAASADEALAGADVFIGLSAPGAVTPAGVRTMAEDAIVFAMANPTPEVVPEELDDGVAVVATGRSDYPNQINNVLAFPGVFRGALDVRATTITKEMEVAAAHAIASAIAPDELGHEYVIPSVFNRDVAPRVAAAVSEAAELSGVARRPRA